MSETVVVSSISAKVTADAKGFNATMQQAAAETRSAQTATKQLNAEIQATAKASSTAQTLPTLQKEVAQATREAAQANRDEATAANEAKSAHEGLEATLERTKETLGRRSLAHEALELLTGGGTVAVLGLAGGILKDSTQRMIELRDRARETAMSSGQITEELAGSLPVLGSIWQAGRNIRELFSGEAGIAKGIQEAAQRADEVTASVRAVAEETAAWRRESGDARQELERTVRDSSLKGLALEVAHVYDAYVDTMKRIQDDFTERTQTGPDIKGLMDQRAKVRAQADALRQRTAVARDNDTTQSWFGEYSDELAPQLDAAERDLKRLDRLIKQRNSDAEKAKKEAEQIAGQKAAADLAEKQRAAAEEASKAQSEAIARGLASIRESNPIDQEIKGLEMLGQAYRAGLIDAQHYMEGVAEVSRQKAEAIAEQQRQIREELDASRKALDEWGMTAGEKAARGVRVRGGTDQQAKEAKDLADAVAALDRIGSIDHGNPLDTYAAKMEALNDLLRNHKELQEQITRAQKEAAKARDDALAADARAWKEKIQTPLEKYKKQLEEISAEVAKGLLTPEEAEKAAALLEKEMAGAAGPRSDSGRWGGQGIEAAEYGSQKAAEVFAQAWNRTLGNSQQDLGRMQLEETKRQSGFLETIARAAAEPPPEAYTGI